MISWWQDLDTGEVFERPDMATCHREATECLLSAQHYVYVSNTRIPPENGAAWRERGCPRPTTQLKPTWEVDIATPAIEDVWSV